MWSELNSRCSPSFSTVTVSRSRDSATLTGVHPCSYTRARSSSRVGSSPHPATVRTLPAGRIGDVDSQPPASASGWYPLRLSAHVASGDGPLGPRLRLRRSLLPVRVGVPQPALQDRRLCPDVVPQAVDDGPLHRGADQGPAHPHRAPDPLHRRLVRHRDELVRPPA